MLTLTVFLEWELLYPFYRQKQRLKSRKLRGKCGTGTIFSESILPAVPACRISELSVGSSLGQHLCMVIVGQLPGREI